MSEQHRWNWVVLAQALGWSVATTTIFAHTSAWASDADSGAASSLAAAEEAYQHVDFSSVYEEARRGLALGAANPQQVSRLCVLLGIASAALGKDDESRQYFVTALAISPKLSLERSLSPKLRGPYLEARGFWEAYPARLTLHASVSNSGSELAIALTDPARLGQQIRVRLRERGAASFREIMLAPASETAAPLSNGFPHQEFEYYVQLLDAEGNRLQELGSETSPIGIKAAAARRTTQLSAGSESSKVGAGSESERSLWLPATLAVGGLAATGVGAYFNVRREEQASKWNSSNCEQPGVTRLAQCHGVDSGRRRAEELAIGFYIGGGLLVAGSVVSWLLGGPSTPKREAPTSTNRAPLSCQVGVLGFGAWCQGQF